ncbi:MAG: hypothetical protein GWN71_18490, partial [Gammaproteobacteria bacterium]|nr:hypothetical protein [Gemmatimonadota bacterium]NIU75487.1 hypothetical protein [Gammaproteobacteria bacterium]
MAIQVWSDVRSRGCGALVLVVVAGLAAVPAAAQEEYTPLQDTIPLDTIRVQVGSRVSPRLPLRTR